MLVADAPEQPEPGLESAGALLHALSSDHPVIVMNAVRDMRFLLEAVELATIPRLAAQPGMTPSQATARWGHHLNWWRSHWSVLPSSSSSSSS